jgi:hypothetical protein
MVLCLFTLEKIHKHDSTERQSLFPSPVKLSWPVYQEGSCNCVFGGVVLATEILYQ